MQRNNIVLVLYASFGFRCLVLSFQAFFRCYAYILGMSSKPVSFFVCLVFTLNRFLTHITRKQSKTFPI